MRPGSWRPTEFACQQAQPRACLRIRRTVPVMISETGPEGQADIRASLRVLYAAAGARLRAGAPDGDADVDLTAIVADGLTQRPAAEILAAGVMSVAELLREVAVWRAMHPSTLVRILHSAQTSMSASPDLFADLLAAAVDYLDADTDALTETDLAALLSPAPAPAVLAVVDLLAGALTWRATDQGIDPVDLVQRICLGLAVRDSNQLPA